MFPATLISKWKARAGSKRPTFTITGLTSRIPPNNAAYVRLMHDAADAGLKACVGNYAWTSQRCQTTRHLTLSITRARGTTC